MAVRFTKVIAAAMVTSTLGACAGVTLPNSQALTDLQTVKPALRELPAVSEPLVVGVYSFTDQTGQRRSGTDRIPVAELSSVLPQGLNSLLVQELKQVGDGGYYRVVEREIIDELLNERNIIQATLRQSGQNGLSPLLLPGIVFTGGAVSYDRTTVQGLAGVSFASIGGTGEVRSDEVGVVLRAVSVSTGEVLATVHARKSVLSTRAGSTGLRILNTDVLAWDVGGAVNEPVSLATRMAIAEAVSEMTELGAERGWWGAPSSGS
jgi:curli production assembly/transport component CsgG